MSRIEVSVAKDSICACNSCMARNYQSITLTVPGKLVDVLYDVRIGNMVSVLCEDCLKQLIQAAGACLSPGIRLVDANKLPEGKFHAPETEYQLGWNDALEAACTQCPDCGVIK